ncbi:hypothetical protein [Maribellus maritimus]|uniref:hypothetical protein n=1 Tax=Maribellus maritimus TaxID=2870838 RepID=UPI001EEA303B|nr:hypothetical protein [Maribellus maritimus]MCG6188779.1 hypothetical protein [Maribellus maritimus]
MNRKLILTLIILTLVGGNVFGQILKYRVGVNYGKFNDEVGKDEVEHPLIENLSNPNATEFVHAFEPGFEAEIMQLWSPNIETGIELDFSKFSGSNDIPPYYNYILAQDFPEITHRVTEPIVYESSALNLILNFRYYFAPDGSINPFFKAFGGLSFVGAEYNYEDLSVWETVWSEEGTGVLYAVGTENSDQPKETAVCYGFGAGLDFALNEQISLYLDGTVSFIGTDKLDGIPNYDYVVETQNLKAVGNRAFVTQISLGIVFTSKTDLGLNKNSGKNKKGSGVKGTGRTTPWRPFYRQKR